MKRTSAILSLILSLLGIHSLHAQAEPELNVSFSCLTWDSAAGEGIKFESGGEVQEVAIHYLARESTYKYSGPNPIVFFREDIDAEGLPIRLPVAVAKIPEGMKRPLLLFFDVKDKKGTTKEYNVFPIEDTFERFPAGSYQFLNISRIPITVKGKDTETLLKPGKPAFVKVNAENGDKIQYLLASGKDIEFPSQKIVTFFYRPDSRWLVFVKYEKETFDGIIKTKLVR